MSAARGERAVIFEEVVDRSGRDHPGRITGFEEDGPEPVRRDELPHPAVTVLVPLGARIRVGAADHDRAFVVGLLDRPAATAHAGRFACVEIRLSPLEAYSVLGGTPLDQLGPDTTELAHLWGRDAARLAEQVAETDDWDGRFAPAVGLLRSAHDAGIRPDPEIELAWSMLVASSGRRTVTDLSAATGWSAKRLRARFRTQVGTTPKRSARLIRFSSAVERLRSGASPADTAAACGFADQSHLHRDVMAFAGCSPRQLTAVAPA